MSAYVYGFLAGWACCTYFFIAIVVKWPHALCNRDHHKDAA